MTLGSGEEATKEVLGTIQAYNRDDCLSALRLQDWLEDRRRTVEAALAQGLPRPETKSGEPSENVAGRLDSAKNIMAELRSARERRSSGCCGNTLAVGPE
jgi:hypothetical protein